MKEKAFNIWFYVPAIVWFVFSIVPIFELFYVAQIELEGEIYEYVPLYNINLFLEMFIYLILNLLIAICISNSRKRVRLFGIIPIILLIIYSLIIRYISEGYILFFVSLGLIIFYGLMYLLKMKFFSKKYR